jgi:hypothetical protein
MQRRITINALSADLTSSAQTKLKSEIVGSLHQRMVKIGQIAEAFGINKVAFGLSLPIQMEPGSVYAPYGAIGGNLSCISAPMIVCTPSPLNVVVSSVAESTGNGGTASESQAEQIKDFLAAHEMVHTAKNHTVISAVTAVASSILISGIWMAGLYGGGLTLGRVACTYGAVAGTSLLSRLFYCTQRRCQEKEADLEAIKYLKSNVGAIAAFDGYDKGVSCTDLEHPPLRDRLNYSKNFCYGPLGFAQ